MALSKGSTVEVKNTLLKGVIDRRKFADDGDTVLYLVHYTDAGGEEHQRWFEESDLIEGEAAETGEEK